MFLRSALGDKMCPCIPSSNLQSMSHYNLIVLGKYSGNCDVQGPSIICGAYTSNSGVVFGINSGRSGVTGKDVMLEINKDYSIGSNGDVEVKIGSVRFGVPPNRTITSTGNDWSINSKKIILKQTSQNATASGDSSLDGRCTNLNNMVSDVSKELVQLSMSANRVTTAGDKINFNVNATDCNGVAVFHINSPFGSCDGTKKFYLNTNKFNVTLVIININGTSVNQTKSCSYDAAVWGNKVPNKCRGIIWNMYNANTVQLRGTICGTVLAPQAKATGTDGVNVIGGLVVNELSWKGTVDDQCVLPSPCAEICASNRTSTTTTAAPIVKVADICKIYL